MTSRVARESILFTASSSSPAPTSSPFHFSESCHPCRVMLRLKIFSVTHLAGDALE